jgi:hypothetical protein
MKKMFLVILLAVFIAPILLYSAEVAPTKDVIIKKSAKTKPAVIFSHTKHEKKIGAKSKDCNACHDAAKTKEGAHKYCTECHKTMKAVPTLAKCNECHKPVK